MQARLLSTDFSVQESMSHAALLYEVKGTAYPLPIEVENNLLRLGQEALSNAIKYADADGIRVELMYETEQCILRVAVKHGIVSL